MVELAKQATSHLDMVHIQVGDVADMPRYPTTAQITEAFRDADNILLTCFTVDFRGEIFHVKNINQLTYGQPIWRKTDVTVFPNFFYSNQAILKQFLATGFHIDKIEDHYTEEKRVAYNTTNPAIPLCKDYVKYPTALVYHVSKSHPQ